ncbi:zinc finger protein Dzip1 [Orussus abietinus]|uniref:zinc finger protein Dzip1 n=1 Tax=Orussus abietinus TaxID=222816 RepID=UPI0006259135|nr:zinc finger protein Dzip1 [Orussus abietinus]
MAFSFRAGSNWCHDFPKLARESGFYFNMHRTRVRVDWNRISLIDIDRVIQERDFYTVDENVNNVVDYCLESEYDVKILDPNFVKLFRLAQLAVEYLLYCKQYLDQSVVILKHELKLKLEENVKFKKELAASEAAYKDLKEKFKEREKAFQIKISDSHGEIHKCPYCPKTFVSAIFVNAHIMRRHQCLSDSCFSSSPIHEQYRAEAEKLHTEIKTLKERLNKTERVIRNESEKSSQNVTLEQGRNIDKLEGECHNTNKDVDKFEEQHKKYQEEITGLKDMLFNEIKKLKQSDMNKSPLRLFDNEISNTSYKELLQQQENEIHILRTQLQESTNAPSKLENLYSKFHAQENYWKSKVEQLESQHRMDIEKLSAQLELTHDTANRIKAEYETKVRDLEHQSLNQSKILSEQREQLSYLSRGIQESHSINHNGLKDFERFSEKTRHNAFEKTAHKKDHYEAKGKKDISRTTNNELIFEDIDSVSSQNSVKSITSVPNNQVPYKELKLTKKANDRATEYVNELRDKKQSQRREFTKKPKKRIDTMSNGTSSQLSTETLRSHSKASPIQQSYTKDIVEPFVSSKSKLKQKINDTVVDSDSSINSQVQDKYLNKSHRSQDVHTAVNRATKHQLRADSRIPINSVAKTEKPVKNSKVLMTDSETSELDELGSDRVQSNSDSESQTESTDESTSQSHSQLEVQPVKKEIVKKTLQQTRDEMLKMFENKLKDLGIDPEWSGLPKMTFQQKMETVKHHQSINAKKFPNYDLIRRKIIQDIAHKLLIRQKASKIETEKGSSHNKVLSNVKTKNSVAVNLQKTLGIETPIIKSQSPTSRQVTPKSKINMDLLPKKLSEQEIRPNNRKPTHTLSNDKSPQMESQPSLLKSSHLSLHREVKTVQSKASMKAKDSSYDMKQFSHSYESINDFLKDTNDRTRSSTSVLDINEISSPKVTSTPNKIESNALHDSYVSLVNEPNIHLTKKEIVNSVPASPKNSKGVLKSATGSTGSLIKKKVLFHLEKEDSGPEKINVTPLNTSMFTSNNTLNGLKVSNHDSVINYDNDDDEEDNWNITSISDEQDQSIEKEKLPVTSNLILKTSQSDKIAQISKKIEEQLSASRHKPVGAVEAMFMERQQPKSEDREDGSQFPSSTSITSSILESPARQIHVKHKSEKREAPLPAPRSLKSKESKSSISLTRTAALKESDLDSDINELLQMD